MEYMQNFWLHIKEPVIESFKNGLFERFFGLLVFIILAVLAGKIVNKIIRRIIERLVEKTPNAESKKQLQTLRVVLASTVNALIYGLLAFHILIAIGVDIRPLLATAGVLGVAIGFGAKRFVEDIISGILILLEGQARVGDIVSIQGIEGTVEKVNLKMVTLRGADGTVHYIRNSLIDVISNKTRDYSVATFDIGITYGENVAKVIGILKDLGKELQEKHACNSVILEPLEVLGLDRFADSSVIVKCQIKTLAAKQWQIKRAFNLMVKEKFDELGIVIPYPHLTVDGLNDKADKV